ASAPGGHRSPGRSEEHTSELQSRGHLVCRLLLEKKKMQSYQVGYTSGWNGAEVSAGFPNDAPGNDGNVRLLSLGTSILSAAGWGRCEIEYDDATGSVRWEFSEGTAIGLAARQEGRRDKPACPFIAGFVAGWTNRSLGTKSEFQETECVSKGDARCVFESADYLRPRAE